MKKECSRIRLFRSMATTTGPRLRCMEMRHEQLAVALTPISWLLAPATTVWLRPSPCGRIARAVVLVGAARPVEVRVLQAWAACHVPRADFCTLLMATKAKPCTAWRRLARRARLSRKRSLWWWVIYAPTQGMKIGALRIQVGRMPMARSITWTSPTTRTAFPITGPSPTRTLSFPGSIAQQTSSSDTGQCQSAVERKPITSHLEHLILQPLEHSKCLLQTVQTIRKLSSPQVAR